MLAFITANCLFFIMHRAACINQVLNCIAAGRIIVQLSLSTFGGRTAGPGQPDEVLA